MLPSKFLSEIVWKVENTQQITQQHFTLCRNLMCQWGVVTKKSIVYFSRNFKNYLQLILKQLVNLFQMWTNVLRIQPFVKTASFVTIHLDHMFVEVNTCF